MRKAHLLRAALAVIVALLAGCGGSEEPPGDGDTPPAGRDADARLSGTVRIDGPRLLHRLGSAAAAAFERETAVEVEVEGSGTEVALDELCTGRVAIAGARRPISATDREVCEERGIGLERLKIANHAVAVATSKVLEVRCLTMRQLRDLWRPGSRVSRYRQLGPALPSAKVELYGPRVDRASFHLFTRLVNGEAGAIRSVWNAAVNRTALTARLQENDDALAFYNLAELMPTTDVRLVSIDAGEGCVEPTEASVYAGRYPLREDLYLYVSSRALRRAPVRTFMQYLVDHYDRFAAVAPSILPASKREIARAARRLPEAGAPVD